MDGTSDITSYLKERDSFHEIPGEETHLLYNIANGMSAQDGANVDTAKSIGKKIMSYMVNECIDDFTFHKANQAVAPNSIS